MEIPEKTGMQEAPNWNWKGQIAKMMNERLAKSQRQDKMVRRSGMFKLNAGGLGPKFVDGITEGLHPEIG